MLCGTIIATLNFSTPYLILKLVAYIKEGAVGLTWENVRPGVIYAGALCATQIVSYVLSEHMSYLNVLTGRRSSNAVIAFIYKKYSRVSPATNKDFNSGQIVNFVQVDAQRLFWISYQISNVVQLPLIFVVSFAASFYMFGYSFFAGLAVFMCAFVANFIIGRILRDVQKKVMKSKDGRMKVTTECVNNIKMIKLYSWQENFLQRIYRRRDIDVVNLRKAGFVTGLLIFFVYAFPSLLPVATFATYISLGQVLEYPQAVAALVLFGLLRVPLIQAPIFFGDLIQLRVSMKRIDKFCSSDEVQTCIKQLEPADHSSEFSLEIAGSYSWGFTSNAAATDKKDKTKGTGKGKEAEVKKGKQAKVEEEKKAVDEKKQLKKFIALKDVKLQVKKGEFLCIIGDVGSGKSSLL